VATSREQAVEIALGPKGAFPAPGHTMGNRSLVLNTEKGIYVVSEIAGVRKHARATGVEVISRSKLRPMRR